MAKRKGSKGRAGAAKGFLDFDRKYPAVAKAYEDLGDAVHAAGPLTGRERRLVKLALAVGGRLEGAVKSHARRALREGVERAALDHVAVLAVPTTGLPTAVAALVWIDHASGG